MDSATELMVENEQHGNEASEQKKAAGSESTQTSLGNEIVFENDTRTSKNKLAEEMTAFFKLSDADKAGRPELIETLIIQRLLLGINAGPSKKPGTKPKESANNTLQSVENSISKVIGTPELLEAILSHLPVLDLVIATGVDKAVPTLILSSPTLRRKLFLLPEKGEPKKMRFKLRNQHQHGEMWQSDEQVKATLCPLLRLQYLWKRISKRHIEESGDEADIEEKTAGAQTWPQMYLNNPPCTTVEVRLSYAGRVPGDLIKTNVEAKGKACH